MKISLNPRLVGQVFRHALADSGYYYFVLIPDLWGKSSDLDSSLAVADSRVLIPDLWGKSSDYL